MEGIENKEGNSPAIEEVLNMPLHFSEAEYARNITDMGVEMSEDALTLLIKGIVQNKHKNFFGNAIRILNRPAMQESSRKDVYEQAIRDAAQQVGYEIKMSQRTYEPSEDEIAQAEEMMKQMREE